MQVRFIVFFFWRQLQSTNHPRDHSGHYPVQILENIGAATEQSDWLILIIGPQAAEVV